MTEQDPHDGHDHHHHETPGFVAMPPHEFAAMMGMHSTNQEMRMKDNNTRVTELIDSLNIAQLLALRLVCAQRRKSSAYIDGQVMTVLRVVHGVDPETGLTPEESLITNARPT